MQFDLQTLEHWKFWPCEFGSTSIWQGWPRGWPRRWRMPRTTIRLLGCQWPAVVVDMAYQSWVATVVSRRTWLHSYYLPSNETHTSPMDSSEDKVHSTSWRVHSLATPSLVCGLRMYFICSRAGVRESDTSFIVVSVPLQSLLNLTKIIKNV